MVSLGQIACGCVLVLKMTLGSEEDFINAPGGRRGAVMGEGCMAMHLAKLLSGAGSYRIIGSRDYAQASLWGRSWGNRGLDSIRAIVYVPPRWQQVLTSMIKTSACLTVHSHAPSSRSSARSLVSVTHCQRHPQPRPRVLPWWSARQHRR